MECSPTSYFSGKISYRLQGHHFSDLLTEHANEVVDKKMSLYGTIRRFSAIQIGIKSIHSSLRFEDQDQDSLPPRLTSLGLRFDPISIQ